MTTGVSGSGDVVLITGGAGFIGSHLAEALLSRGHQVRVIDDLSTGRKQSIASLVGHPRFTFRRASLADEDAVDELAEGAAVVFHLAATVGVCLVMDEPARAIECPAESADEAMMSPAHLGQASVHPKGPCR